MCWRSWARASSPCSCFATSSEGRPVRTVLAVVSGLAFGLGLIASGMTDPAKIKAFLDLLGHWDPSLAFVMAGAIAVGLPAFALARRRRTAWSGDTIEIPSSTTIDRRL